jgi:drug/metabolite transporter (DMT)-like permease
MITEASLPVAPATVAGVLLLGVVAVSFASILIRWTEAPALTIAFYRLLLAATIFWMAQGRLTATHLRRATATLIGLSALSGLALAVHFAAWISSLSLTSVASSVVLVSTTPIWVAAASRLLFHEPLRLPFIVGLLIAMGGAMFIGVLDAEARESSLLGNVLALVGALAGAVYLLIGRRVQRELNTWAYVTATYSSAAIVLLLWAVLAGSPLRGFTWQIYGMFALIAVVPQVIGHTSFNWSLKHLSAPMVSVALLGEPIGASVLACFLLNEKLGWLKIAAAALTLGGVLMAAASEKVMQTKTEQEVSI